MNQRIRNLIAFKVYAELKAEAQRTYIGFMWWIIEPLLFMSVYYFVFGIMLNWRSTENYVPFLIIGVSTWHWWQSSVMNCANSLVSNRPIITQVVVPKYVFPTVSILVNLTKFLFVYVIILGFLTYYGFQPSVIWASTLITLIGGLLLAYGAGLMVGAILPLVPDLRILLDNGMRAMMFMSGIFYDIENINGSLKEILMLNPVVPMIQNLRSALLQGTAPDVETTAYVYGVALALIAAGLLMLKRFDGKYAKAPW